MASSNLANKQFSKQFTYTRHKPEETVLYKIIQNNWLPFQDQVLRDAGYPLPDFVVKEFDEYLRCGILAYWVLARPVQVLPFCAPNRVQLLATRVLPELRRAAHE